jgi:hypothetical protein
MTISRNTLTRLAAVIAAIGISMAAVACGDDSGDPSATETFCNDLDSVNADVNSLEDMEISVDNASEIGSTVEQFGNDVDSLEDAASGAEDEAAASDEVSEVQDAMSDLESSVSDLASDGSVDDVSSALDDVKSALDGVTSSAGCS